MARSAVPHRYASDLPKLRSKADVEAFVDAIGVSAGVVVGRLHYGELWKPTNGNQLKRWFSAEDLEAVYADAAS